MVENLAAMQLAQHSLTCSLLSRTELAIHGPKGHIICQNLCGLLLSLALVSVSTGGVWYTDANGLEWQQRKLGYQPSYPADSKALATNLYPMTTGGRMLNVYCFYYVVQAKPWTPQVPGF